MGSGLGLGLRLILGVRKQMVYRHGGSAALEAAVDSSDAGLGLTLEVRGRVRDRDRDRVRVRVRAAGLALGFALGFTLPVRRERRVARLPLG